MAGVLGVSAFGGLPATSCWRSFKAKPDSIANGSVDATGTEASDALFSTREEGTIGSALALKAGGPSSNAFSMPGLAGVGARASVELKIAI